MLKLGLIIFPIKQVPKEANLKTTLKEQGQLQTRHLLQINSHGPKFQQLTCVGCIHPLKITT